MSLRGAMRVLSDEQLLATHDQAQAKVIFCLTNGYESVVGGHVRRARAAEKEILSRGRFSDARNHTERSTDDRTT